MDGFLRVLLALVAALNSALAAPLVTGDMPDRPPIVAPTLQPLPADASSSPLPLRPTTRVVVGGTVSDIQDGTIVVSGQSIHVSSATTITGDLKVGAVVNVEANRDGDSLEATQVEVGEDGRPTRQAEPTESSLSIETQPTEPARTATRESSPEAETEVGATTTESSPDSETHVGEATPTVSAAPAHAASDNSEVKPSADHKTTPAGSGDHTGTSSKDSNHDSGKSSDTGSGGDHGSGSDKHSDQGGGSTKGSDSGD
ncbi:MAG: DUF5666 domain-containing protein [Chloroflexi bacterium]|nr:DUF5666 domain-containing protein [Chloroflexota bacterium]